MDVFSFSHINIVKKGCSQQPDRYSFFQTKQFHYLLTLVCYYAKPFEKHIDNHQLL